jgi:hypothetical protein
LNDSTSTGQVSEEAQIDHTHEGCDEFFDIPEQKSITSESDSFEKIENEDYNSSSKSTVGLKYYSLGRNRYIVDGKRKYNSFISKAPIFISLDWETKLKL